MVDINAKHAARMLVALGILVTAGCAGNASTNQNGASSSGYGSGATVSSGAESRPTTQTMPVAPPHASSDAQPGQGNAITGGAEGASADQATSNGSQGNQR